MRVWVPQGSRCRRALQVQGPGMLRPRRTAQVRRPRQGRTGRSLGGSRSQQHRTVFVSCFEREGRVRCEPPAPQTSAAATMRCPGLGSRPGFASSCSVLFRKAHALQRCAPTWSSRRPSQRSRLLSSCSGINWPRRSSRRNRCTTHGAGSPSSSGKQTFSCRTRGQCRSKFLSRPSRSTTPRRTSPIALGTRRITGWTCSP
mmetsp:Transcript_27744/g.83009  ORF Transcript_27744/g.83009 Transcript_27744/m.83009 type:complete len:201 (+) Transcript_27744:132-734(+)